jgi:hypothetical protein
MNVFLSHSSVDERLADQVRSGLERHGLEVWSDRSIKPGDVWGGSIGAALSEADSFVFLLGSRSASGPWTSLELGKALASGKRVVPVLADPDAEVPALLQGYQYLDLSDPSARDRGIGQLSKVLVSAWGERETRTEAIENVEEATARLGEIRAAQANAMSQGLTAMARAQVAVAAIAVLATTGVLLTVAGTVSELTISIVAGLLTALGWIAGFYRGRSGSEATDE